MSRVSCHPVGHGWYPLDRTDCVEPQEEVVVLTGPEVFVPPTDLRHQASRCQQGVVSLEGRPRSRFFEEVVLATPQGRGVKGVSDRWELFRAEQGERAQSVAAVASEGQAVP